MPTDSRRVTCWQQPAEGARRSGRNHSCPQAYGRETELRDSGERPGARSLDIVSPAGEKKQLSMPTLNPHDSVNVGWLKLDGWPIPTGSEVTVSCKDYGPRVPSSCRLEPWRDPTAARGKSAGCPPEAGYEYYSSMAAVELTRFGRVPARQHRYVKCSVDTSPLRPYDSATFFGVCMSTIHPDAIAVRRRRAVEPALDERGLFLLALGDTGGSLLV